LSIIKEKDMTAKFFKRRNKTDFHYPPQELTRKLKVLEKAISDVGYWAWWTADFPTFIMLEFGGSQIWTKPKDNESPPSGLIGITFLNPYSVSFVTRKFHDMKPPDNWAELLHNDDLDLPEIEYGLFTFTNNDLIELIIENAVTVETVFGIKPTNPEFKNAEFKFGFWANNFGCIISCESISIISHDGDLSLDDVENRRIKWWEYWEEYWVRRNTENPLPADYACEVTIPPGQQIKIKGE